MCDALFPKDSFIISIYGKISNALINAVKKLRINDNDIYIITIIENNNSDQEFKYERHNDYSYEWIVSISIPRDKFVDYYNISNVIALSYREYNNSIKIQDIISCKKPILCNRNKERESILGINYPGFYNSNTNDDIESNNIFSVLYFLKHGFKQVMTSNSIKYFHDKIKHNYKLEDFKYYTEPCIFFGLYIEEDYKKLALLKNKFNLIIWGGTDLVNFSKKNYLRKKYLHFLKKDNIYHMCISLNLYNICNGLKITNMFPNDITLITFDIPEINATINIDERKCIYCYDGNKGTVYNVNLLKIIEKKMPQYKFIYSSSLKLTHNEMPNIYKKCFVILRLTNWDGNANTVLEGGIFGVPSIHNGTYKYSLPWTKNNINEIVKNIEKTRNYNVNQIKEISNYYITLYNKLLCNKFLKLDNIFIK